MARLAVFTIGVLTLALSIQLVYSAAPTCRSGSSYDRTAYRGREGGICLSGNRCVNGLECCSTNSAQKRICQQKVSCENGFLLNDAAEQPKCVKLQTKREPYTTALFKCILEGMALMSLRSQAEVDWLQEVRRNNSAYNKDLWLGGQVERAEGMKWISRQYVASKTEDFTKWGPNEPSCLVYDECSLVSQQDGDWVMVHYQESLHYACEKSL